MKVVESDDDEYIDGKGVEKLADKASVKGREIRTDGLDVYNELSKNGYTLTQKVYDPKNEPEHLHWIRIIVSNAKAFISGAFHRLDANHLQRYLNEFCY